MVFHGSKLYEHLVRLVWDVLMLVVFKCRIERADIQIDAEKRIKLSEAGTIGAL